MSIQEEILKSCTFSYDFNIQAYSVNFVVERVVFLDYPELAPTLIAQAIEEFLTERVKQVQDRKVYNIP